ncbi:MAG: LPS export ABC transporter periplasmic protein LptC [Alistipes sp.]|nr:LPS export ABC transporter periplasmic protein LptC [Alistipes sp.]
MLKHSLIRNLSVALPLLGSAILLFSCQASAPQTEEPTESQNAENMMTEYSENLSIVMSENGLKSYHFETPLMEGYTLARDPYREFRKGIKITMFEEDSTSSDAATLTANYAIFYENRKLWEAKGDVVVIQTNGRRLYTQQLFWNQSTHRIYSNVDSRIVDGDEMTDCEGFESDEEMVQWKYRKLKGVTYFTMSENGGTKSDSTKVDKTSPKKEPAKSTARPAAKPKTANKPKAGQRPKTPMVTPASPRFDAPRSGAQRKVEPIQSSRLEGQNIEDVSNK